MKARGALAFFVLLLFFGGVPVHAQDDPPKVEVFGGYSYANLDLFAPFGQRNNAHGWGANVALNFGKRFGLAADFAGHYWEDPPPLDGTFSMHEFLLGPRVAFRAERVTGFVHALFGVAHIWESETNFIRFFPSRSDTGFAMGFGGGLDIHLNRRVSIRIFQADYLPVDSPLIGEWRHNVRVQTGLVWRF
jgi:hypothetical protein